VLDPSVIKNYDENTQKFNEERVDLNESYFSLPSNSTFQVCDQALELNSDTKKKKKSLKSVIKKVKADAIEALITELKNSDTRTMPLVFRVARIFMKTDINKAREILRLSHLPEAKYMLMEIAFNTKSYLGVFHYGSYLNIHKCT